MKTTMMVLATAATLAVTAVAVPRQAEAGGGQVAAGVIGGLAAGAIIGGAIASSPGYYYGPGYGYAQPYGYYAGPVGYPGCYWQRQRFWDGFVWRVRRVQICG